MTDSSTPGPEHDLPGMIRRHPNGALYARRETEPRRGILQDAQWVAVTATQAAGRVSHLFDEEMEGSARVTVIPGTPAAYATGADLTLTVTDREAATDQLARALLTQWCTDYAWSPKPWEELRPEDQRAFRRRARAVLPVLDRWNAIAQQLAAAAAEGGDRG